MKNKILLRQCPNHRVPLKDRKIEDYVFWVTNHKGVDLYECKKCREQLEKDVDRDNRIQQHNQKQQREYWERYDDRMRKKKNKIKKSIKEDIWDFVVRDELAKGTKLKGHKKYLYKESIPKEILQVKRASMKLERLINKMKDGYKSKKQIEEEEINKLKGPLVECKKHGVLFLKDVIKAGKSRWTQAQRYKCRKCMSECHRDHYLRHKDYILKKCAKYRKDKPEKIIEMRKKYKEKMNGKNREHDTIKR